MSLRRIIAVPEHALLVPREDAVTDGRVTIDRALESFATATGERMHADLGGRPGISAIWREEAQRWAGAIAEVVK